MHAAFRMENTLGSYLGQEQEVFPVETPAEFEPLDHVRGYEEYSTDAMDFTTMDELNLWKSNIDRQRKDRQILDQAGWRGVVSMMAMGAIDPINLPFLYAPIGVGMLRGGSIARGVTIEGGAAMAATVPQEALLHETQQTRTATESALNVGASVLIGGTIGAIAARNAGNLDQIIRAVDDDFGDAPRVTRADAHVELFEQLSKGVDTIIEENVATATGRLTKAFKRTVTKARDEAKGAQRKIQEKMRQLEGIEQVRSVAALAGRGPGRTFGKAVPPRVVDTKIWKDIAREELGDEATTEMVSNRAKDLRRLYEDKDLYPVMKAEVEKIQRQVDELNGQLAVDRQALKAEKLVAKIKTMRASGRSDGEIIAELNLETPQMRLEDVGDPETVVVSGPGGNLSAAKASERGEYAPVSGEDTVTVGASWVNKLGWLSPLGQVVTSQSAKARALMLELAENSWRFAGLKEGIAPPTAVESILKRYTGARHLMARAVKRLHADYRKKARAAGQEPRSLREFLEDTGRAMRNNDESEIAEVATAAKLYRKHIFDPLKKALDDEGLLPEGEAFKTADSYLTRIYDRDALRNNAEGFQSLIANYLKKIKDDIDPEEANEIAREVWASILGHSHGQMDWTADFVAKGGPLHKRTLLIPDSELEKGGFLRNNVDEIATDYVRTVAPRVELTRRFGSFDLSKELKDIADEYGAMIRDNPENAKSLEREMRATQKNLAAVRDRILGTYGVPKDPGHWLVRASRATRALNLLTMLGAMTVSALPDMIRPMAVHGFRSYGRGFMSIGRAMSTLNLENLQKMGTALDMMHSSRLNAMADLDDIVGQSAFESGLQEGTKLFGRASLMAPWNTFWKGFTGMLAQDEMLRSAVKVADGTATPKEIERLVAHGIDENMARRIAEQPIDKDGDMWLANWDEWTDPEVKEVYQGNMVKIVDSTIVTPGAGDIPALPDMISPELGKVLLQFKTFAFTAQNRMLIAGLQQNDARFYSSVLLSMAVGSMAYAAKTKIADRELPDEWSKFAVEAIDHAGYLGWMMEGNNMMERATGGALGLNPLVGMLTGEEHELMSRYAARTGVSALLGPTIGSTLPNIMGALRLGASAATGNDMYSSDVRAIRKLIPFQNVFYLRRLFDKVEGAATDAIGTRY
jgi:hypothetical protein